MKAIDPSKTLRNGSPGKLATAVDSVLTPERLRVYSAVLVIGFGVSLALSWALPGGQTPLPDYAARWTAGRLLLDGRLGSLYDPAVQAAMQQQELGSTGLSWFVSPPFVAILFAPLAVVPYWLSCALWSAISVGALFLSLRLLQPLAPSVLKERWGSVIWLIIASYPVLELVGGGQDTTLVLLAIVLGIRLLNAGCDLGAGGVLALGCIKPQLLFLVPALLLCQRRFRALSAFFSLGMALVAVSMFMVGPDVFHSWLELPHSQPYATAVQQDQAWKAVSASAWLTAVAPPIGGSSMQWATTAVGLAFCIPGIVAVRSRGVVGLTDWALVLAVTVVASPHFMAYDLVLAIPVLMGLAECAWTAVTRVSLAVTFVLLWLIAPLHALVGSAPWPLRAIGAPWAALAFIVLWRTLVRHSRYSNEPSCPRPGRARWGIGS